MLRHTFFVTLTLVAGLLCAPLAFAAEEMVPDVVGLNIQKAKALMDEAGFPIRVQNVTGKPLGIVFSQDPGGLSELDTSTTITLQVGAPTPKPGFGADPLPPTGRGADPRGTDPRGADPKAADSNDIGTPPTGAMEPGAVPTDPAAAGRTPPSDTTPSGTTPSGSGAGAWPSNPVDRPAAEGFVWNGTPVPAEALADTNGPDLPGVLGQTTGRARRALRQYRVRVEQTSAMPELVGQVLNQWPFAGSKLALGEEVTIVVGVGRLPSAAHRGVPQVQDQPWRNACQSVKRAGFLIRLTAVSSPDSKRGMIVMQTPLPGSLLERGQTMHLRIGAGSGRYVPGRAGSSTPGGTAQEGSATPPAGAGTSPIGVTPTRPTPTDKPPREVPKAQPPARTPPADTPPANGGQSQEEPETPSTGRALAAPALRTPKEGESYPNKFGADFSWSAMASATSYELELQEELPSGAWQKLSSHTVTSPKFRPKRLEKGRYRWRVRAISANGPGTWSQFFRLYMY